MLRLRLRLRLWLLRLLLLLQAHSAHRFDAFRNACGTPKCCCSPCCDCGCSAAAPAMPGLPGTPAGPKPEPIGPPKEGPKEMPKGAGAAQAPLTIGAGTLEVTPTVNPRTPVIVEPETTRSPF